MISELRSQKKTTTLSVMWYYSPEFAAVTDDIEGYIGGLVAYTNYAYLNSDVSENCQKNTSYPKQ